MTRKMRSMCWLTTGLGLALLNGCQTYHPESGLTLPSAHYLRHPPQYFPQSPPYPLPKETQGLEDAAKQVEENPRPVGP